MPRTLRPHQEPSTSRGCSEAAAGRCPRDPLPASSPAGTSPSTARPFPALLPNLNLFAATIKTKLTLITRIPTRLPRLSPGDVLSAGTVALRKGWGWMGRRGAEHIGRFTSEGFCPHAGSCCSILLPRSGAPAACPSQHSQGEHRQHHVPTPVPAGTSRSQQQDSAGKIERETGARLALLPLSEPRRESPRGCCCTNRGNQTIC